MKKRMAALPWPTRMVVGTLMFVVCSWGAMRLGVSVWMDGLNELDEQNDFEYDSSFFAMNGDFGARNVRITHYDPEGNVQVVILADRMVVHTPGLHWLWWSTFRRVKNVPDEIGFTLENARDASRTETSPGQYSNLPYEAMGCGKDKLTPAFLQAMGLPEPRRDATLWLRRKGDGQSTLSMDLVTRDMGELKIDMDVSLERPLKWRESLEQLEQAKVQGAKMSLRDLGFIAARNRYCAKAGGLQAGAFQAAHQRAVAEAMRKSRVRYDAQTLARYNQFAANGGELVIATSRAPSTELMKFAFADFFQRLEQIPTTISYNGEAAAALHVERILPGEITAPIAAAAPATAVAAAVPASTTAPTPQASGNVPATPAASSATTPAPPPVAAPAAAAKAAAPALPAGTLSYAGLKGREGAHVEIVTNNGTARRGTLTAYSAYLSTIRLDADEGGFMMTIPSSSVLEVHALSGESAQVATGKPAAASAGPAAAAPRG